VTFKISPVTSIIFYRGFIMEPCMEGLPPPFWSMCRGKLLRR
jgi:hypothetical protein